CQLILLDSAESHPPVIEKPILRHGFCCYQPLPNDPQSHRRFLAGTQLTSRGSQVRNLHRPPMKSRVSGTSPSTLSAPVPNECHFQGSSAASLPDLGRLQPP